MTEPLGSQFLDRWIDVVHTPCGAVNLQIDKRTTSIGQLSLNNFRFKDTKGPVQFSQLHKCPSCMSNVNIYDEYRPVGGWASV